MAISEMRESSGTSRPASRHERRGVMGDLAGRVSTAAVARPEAVSGPPRGCTNTDAPARAGEAASDALLRKWLRLLPHPYAPVDRKADYRYQISILQAEFSLTQVLDRPVTGRVFFEEVIRENLDIGRPSQVQL